MDEGDGEENEEEGLWVSICSRFGPGSEERWWWKNEKKEKKGVGAERRRRRKALKKVKLKK